MLVKGEHFWTDMQTKPEGRKGIILDRQTLHYVTTEGAICAY